MVKCNVLVFLISNRRNINYDWPILFKQGFRGGFVGGNSIDGFWASTQGANRVSPSALKVATSADVADRV